MQEPLSVSPLRLQVACAEGKFEITDAAPLPPSKVAGPRLEVAVAECRSKLKVLGLSDLGLLQVPQP
jgi:hypothetical protein